MRSRHRYLGELLSGLSPTAQLQKIVDDRMCIGCGLCESIAGSETIQMRIDEDGNEQPFVREELSEETIEQIKAVCPGTRLEGMPDWLVEPDSGYDEVWGVYRTMVMAWSSSPDVRHIGATGGLLTALALHLIESGKVDFVLHADAGHADPGFGAATISRTPQQVIAAAGSRYGPTATLVDFTRIVERALKDGETFALIGTPCDISAARNLARLDPRVDTACRYMLAMVCGGFMSPAGMKDALRGFDIDPERVTSVRYRGYGCPGPTRVETDDGAVVDKDYLDFWGEDDSAWQLPHRCKVCADGIGDAADIAASDTWDGGAPTRDGQADDPGSNAALVRTARGAALLDAAVDSGHVTLGESLTPRDMDRFQPHQVVKKKNVWARFVGMRSAGQVVPDVRGLRLKPLARRNTLNENLAQARGARKRSRRTT